MIFSGAPLSSLPLSSSFADHSVASPFSALIGNQDATRAYLLDCQPYDPDAAAEVDVGFSVGLTRPLLGGRMWPARLATALNAQVDLFADEIGRGGSSSFGVIKVLMGDTDHDEILGYAWDGRPVRLLMGAEGFDYTEFEPVFVGTAADIEWGAREMSIILRDKAELLRVPIQETLYDGSGGLEGGDDIKNQPKPLCYGDVSNAAPVLVDRANLIYQIHDGSIEAVDAVYDGADELTFAADVADITATSVSLGQYKTQLSGGYIRLGAEPAKALTVDARGDNAGGYVDSAASIAQRMVINHSTLTSADINAQSVSDTNTANSSAVGWCGNSGTVWEIIGAIAESIGGSCVFNRAGELFFAVFAFTSSSGTIDRDDIVSIQRVRTPVPSWRRALGYAKSWTVQGQNDVLSAADAARKDFVANEYRYAVDEDATIKTRRTLARAVEINTLLDDATEAGTEATRQQGIFGADRNIYRVVTKRQQFKYRAGQTITIDYGRWGFESGADAIILGIVENTDRRETEFRVFV